MIHLRTLPQQGAVVPLAGTFQVARGSCSLKMDIADSSTLGFLILLQFIQRHIQVHLYPVSISSDYIDGHGLKCARNEFLIDKSGVTLYERDQC